MVLIDVLRILICAVFFGYASYLDIKTRRVPNKVWLVMIIIGSPFVAYDLYTGGSSHLIRLLASVIPIYVVMYLLFRMGTFGGADAKALIVLSYIIPVYPKLTFSSIKFPVNGTPFGIDPFSLFFLEGQSLAVLIPSFVLINLFSLFAFTTFFNGLIIFIIVPFGILTYNLFSLSKEEMKKDPILMFFGHKCKISDLNGKHVRLVHSYKEGGKDGTVIRKFKRGGVKIDDDMLSGLEKLCKNNKIDESVWVSALLPFMISITFGFITAIIFGNLMFALM